MISSLALAFAATMPAPPPVSVESILREMTDLRRLAQRSDPWYRYKQWTSYDRNPNDPFANGDYGQFIRDEMVDGRKEQVMADVKGPGALVRLWSANPAGVIRFYFDGETKPRLVSDLIPLLSGKNPLFPEPFAYMASSGANFYYPLPFAKSLKVTWDGQGKVPNAGLYYAVGIREYVPGTKVTTFTATAVDQAKAAKGLHPAMPPVSLKGGTVPPGGLLEAKFSSSLGGELSDFEIQFGNSDPKDLDWTEPTRTAQLLRKLRLRMSFDGETSVDTPLGDFFGSAMGVTPFESLPLSVKPDGAMVARWSMPFKKAARIWIVNDNATPVKLKMGARQSTRLFVPGTYLFHARWHAQTKPTRPMYDFNFLNATGEGRLVGVGLAVSNPVAAWWGEGDEKVYVDGETFPSLFGTGTEDYFGYAWCNPEPFSRPYHAQPPTANLGNLGQTQNSRYHILDDIPFKSSVRFDMEAWHWANVKATYATTAYWYALPGTTLPEAPDPAELPIPDAPLPKPVRGAIEGESLNWTVTNGIFEIQSGFAQISGAKQAWWREPKVGSVATTTIQVPSSGRYELFANLGHARDYGKYRITVGGNAPKEFDFFQEDLEWKRLSLGVFDLPKGATAIHFETLAANPKSEPGKNMLGVDYFLLTKQ